MRNSKKKISLALSLLFVLTIIFSSPVFAGNIMELRGRQMGPIENLGAPLSEVQTLSAVYGIENGHNMMYTTSNGFPGVFSVIDLDTYELVRSFPLQDTSRSWTHAIDKNGNVFIGGYGLGSADARLFHYSPVTQELEDLGVAIPGENVIWDITVDEDGNVYGGTFANGKVFKYDVAAKEFIDFGQVDPAEDNVRAIAYYNGYIYAGTGPLNGRVWKINANNPQDKTRIEIPDRLEYNKDSMKYVYDLTIIGNHLYTFFNGQFVMMPYDMDEEVWLVDHIYKPVRGGIGLSPEFNGKAYYAERIIGAFKLMEIDLATGVASPAPVDYALGLREMALVTLPNQPDFPGEVIITNNYNGGVILMDMENGKVKTLPSLAQPGETSIQSIEKGNDGKIYISGYMGSSGGQFDPDTNNVIKFALAQVEGMTPLGDKMYMGVYPGARIFELDTTKPMGTSNKPKELFSMADDEQDRPFAMTSGDGKLFIGTIPDYGKLGGALAVYDPVTGEKSVYRNVVENQGINAIVYKDGKVYGSTTVSGGLGITPTESIAKIFVWDVEKGEKVKEIIPDILDLDTSPKAIAGLTFGPDGLLWGVAQNILFSMDPDTLEVIHKKQIAPNNWGGGHYWRPTYMKWGKDGLLYTTLGAKLTVFDTETLNYCQLANTSLMTLDDNGHIYFTQSSQFYKVPVTGEVTPVDPGEPIIPGTLDITTPTAVCPDQEFNVVLSTKDSKDLYSLLAKIDYEPTELEVVKVLKSEDFGDNSTLQSYIKDGNLFITASQIGDSVINDDKDVAIICFKVVASSGSTQIKLRKDSELALLDADVTEKIYNLDNEIVRTIDIVVDLEDVNKDGIVNLLDVVMVAKNIGKSLTETNQVYDVNRDGKIDVSDLALVAMRMMSDLK